MTVIVGVVRPNTVWLGGDRAATNGGDLSRTILKEPKVFVKRDVGLGFCGTPKALNAVEHVIDFPEHVEGTDKSYLIGTLVPAIKEGLKRLDCTVEDPKHGTCFQGSMLVAYRGCLYEMQGNFQLIESQCGFAAIGSGGKDALGYMRSNELVTPQSYLRGALEAAAEFNAGCAPPFDIIYVKTRDRG